MRDPFSVLSLKEAEISRLRREIGALRLVIDLLDEEREKIESHASGIGGLPSSDLQTGAGD